MKNQKGFTLVQTMVALGIMAVASVGLMKVSKQTAKTQKRAEVFQDIFTIENRIQLMMVNPLNCAASLGPIGTPVQNGKEITIRRVTDANPAGEIIYQGNDTVYYNNLRVENIRLADVNLQPDNGSLVGSANIELVYYKTSNLLDQQNTRYVKKIEVPRILADAAGNMQSCQSDEAQAAIEAARRLCRNIGGVFDNEINRNCVFPGVGNQPAEQTTVLEDRLDPRYFETAGDTVTGTANFNGSVNLNDITTLNGSSFINAPVVTNGNGTIRANALVETVSELRASGDLNANGATTTNGSLTVNQGLTSNGIIQSNENVQIAAGKKLCIGAKCLDFENDCNANEYFRGFDAAGNSICTNIPSSACGAGEYITSVEPSGKINCGIIPESGRGQCPATQFLQGYDLNGNRICVDGVVPDKTCQFPKILEGFDANGDPNCVDPIGINQACPPPSVLVGYGPTGVPECQKPVTVDQKCNPPEVLVGYDSNGMKICERPQDQSSLQISSPVTTAAGNGNTAKDLGVHDMCFLTQVGLDSNDRGSNPDFNCRVERRGERWSLVVDGLFRINTVTCKAQCISLCDGPKKGYWSTTGYGQCRCPQGSRTGTQTVQQECRGTKCGGSCDASERRTSQACSCAGPPGGSGTCPKPDQIRCVAYGNQCVLRTQCPDVR